MKGLGAGTYDDFLKQMSSRMSVLYREFMYLEDSDRLDSKSRQEFMGIYMENGDADLGASLFMLLRMLYAYHGRKVVLLIDEYDSSVNDARTEDDRRRILDFMKQFLGGALKGNEALRFAVVTGVLQIAKESIFSGLNNLVVNNVFSRESDEMFGFTASEVQAICEDYGHPEKYPEAKEWYDGYRFGNAEIYNPWSVLSYVKLGFVPGTYWAGTSGNSIVPDLVDRADRETRESLRILAEGGSIRWPVEPMVTFADLGVDGGAIWSVMVMSGSSVPRRRRPAMRYRFPTRRCSGCSPRRSRRSWAARRIPTSVLSRMRYSPGMPGGCSGSCTGSWRNRSA